MSDQIIFVIHTNSYSGNFEREMCGYVTGQVGECGVGDDMAELFVEDLGEDAQEAFAEIIGEKMDEGCGRPCKIYETPGRLNDGMGNMFDAIEGAEGWPAYESVAIYFDDMPSDDQIDLMKARAVEYAKTEYNRKEYHATRDPLIITGFELIVEKTQVTRSRKAV